MQVSMNISFLVYETYSELHETGAGKDVWLLTKAVDLVHYRKSTVVKLRKRVRELEQQQQSANGIG